VNAFNKARVCLEAKYWRQAAGELSRYAEKIKSREA